MPARPKNKAPAKKAKRQTVATLAAELAELRGEVDTLRERLAKLEAAPAKPAMSAAPVAAAATSAPVAASKPRRAPPPDNTELALKALLTDALALALEPMPEDPDDADRLFERFASLCHSSRCGTPMLDTSLRTYTWRQLRKNVGIYLREERDAASFEVLRTEPRKMATKSDRIKFFLRARTRMPTPITFRRDAELEGDWRIEVSSL